MALKKLTMEKHFWLADLPQKKFEKEEKQWTNNPFYKTNRWRKLSEEYRKEHPLCEECQRAGRVTPSKITDHIKPINSDDAYDMKNGKYGDPLDWNNLQALCRKCHARKSGKEAHL